MRGTFCLACVLIVQLVQADETAPQLLRRANAATAQRDHQQAAKLLTEAIAKDDQSADAFYLRGRANFRLGKVTESVADFDRYVRLTPELESRQWERGIACYYAKQYEKGAKQFELYQTFHNNDVENSVWRYLCMTPTVGVEKAQAAMLPIENDGRVPMMQVYDLFCGKLTVDDVLAATKAGNPPPEVLAGRTFYAELYIGLWYEVQGKADLARKFILQSAAEEYRKNPRINTYMWDVARIHADRLRKANSPEP